LSYPARGRSAPLGATLVEGGVNFSLFSAEASAVELLLFDRVEDARPSRIIELDPRAQRIWNYWHAFVPGACAGQLYGYRVHGPFMPAKGLCFDGAKLLLDPYARCVAIPSGRSRLGDSAPGDNVATAARSVVTDPGAYDWEGDLLPRTPFENSVIYELHVGNFSRHSSSGVAGARRGTFAGLIDKIPYLRDLGVTAVELMPVFAFDEASAPPGRRNVWGYQPISFFAPHRGYSSRPDPLGALDEFRDLVKAMHRAAIEVILDVVYNHTAEGGPEGPTLSLRGLANDTYYILDGDGAYADYTGTGNTLNANEAIVRRLIIDSLRYWVSEMHVDGFRFDLAAVLSRDERGLPVPSPPVVRDIESDPVLANVKLIAEAWDARGLYEVGYFAGHRFREWNGRFRDDLRRFLKGDERTVQALASRLSGSQDLYGAQRYAPSSCDPTCSINFATCHDGFTLRDLVSYNHKHNEANGEANRDGADENYSWNCGVEGPTADVAINRLRNRQMKNFLTVTLLSAGTPMLLMGDELGRTQNGNNNAYCIDDESVWLDWRKLDSDTDLHRFVRELIKLRLRPVPAPSAGGEAPPLTPRLVEWHGTVRQQPDWSDSSHSLAATVHFHTDEVLMHWMLNAYWEPLSFEIAPPEGRRGPWRRCIDTYQSAPQDICVGVDAPLVRSARIVVEPRSMVVLLSRLSEAPQGAGS